MPIFPEPGVGRWKVGSPVYISQFLDFDPRYQPDTAGWLDHCIPRDMTVHAPHIHERRTEGAMRRPHIDTLCHRENSEDILFIESS
jgi:hypothetical protein